MRKINAQIVALNNNDNILNTLTHINIYKTYDHAIHRKIKIMCIFEH